MAMDPSSFVKQKSPMTILDESGTCHGRVGRLLPQRLYTVSSTISGSVWKLTQFT